MESALVILKYIIQSGPFLIFGMAWNQFNGGFFILWIRIACHDEGYRKSAKSVEISWEFLPSRIVSWCHGPAAPRLGNREILVEMHETMVPWTVIHQRPYVIPGAFVWNCGLSFCKISNTVPFAGTLTIRKRANDFACRFSKTLLGQWGSLGISSWLCDNSATQPCWSSMPWSTLD